MSVTIATQSFKATRDFGSQLAKFLRPGDMLAIIGELGAGKTQLVTGIAAGLGLNTEDVASPTYVLLHEYAAPDASGMGLIHIDAYRIHSLDDLESMGWDDLPAILNRCVVAVEWADRVESELPTDYLGITMRHQGEHERMIELVGHGQWQTRLDEAKLIDRMMQ